MAKNRSRRPRRHDLRHTLSVLAKRAALAILSDVAVTIIHVLVDRYLPPVLPGA